MAAHCDLQVSEVRTVRLDHGAERKVGVGAEPGDRHLKVGHHVDPDRGATEAGLDDVRTFEADRGRRRAQRDTRQRWDPSLFHECPKGELVHPKRSARQVRSRVGDAGEVEGRLQRPILTRSTMRAQDDDVDLQGPCGAEASTLRSETARLACAERQRSRTLRRPLEECASFECGVDLDEGACLGPVDGDRRSTLRAQLVSCLQPGQDADVVLR